MVEEDEQFLCKCSNSYWTFVRRMEGLLTSTSCYSKLTCLRKINEYVSSILRLVCSGIPYSTLCKFFKYLTKLNIKQFLRWTWAVTKLETSLRRGNSKVWLKSVLREEEKLKIFNLIVASSRSSPLKIFLRQSNITFTKCNRL